MATHSSVLAWRILWTEEPARRQSRGSQRVGHGLATKQQPPADFMDENSSVVQKCPVPKSLNLLMAESGFEPQGVSTVVSLSSVRRQQFQVAAPALLPVATSAGCSSLPCLSTQPAFLTASWRHFTKRQGGRRQAGCFFSLLAASSLSALFFFFFFFKKHHHTYIDVILVFYGLKMTDSGGVFPVVRVSLPAGNHCPWASVHRQHCAPHPIDTQPHLG